jgi:hypothetical protein
VPCTKTVCVPTQVTRTVKECKMVCVPRTICRQMPATVCVQIPTVVCDAVLPSPQSVLATPQSDIGCGSCSTIPACGEVDRHALFGHFLKKHKVH